MPAQARASVTHRCKRRRRCTVPKENEKHRKVRGDQGDRIAFARRKSPIRSCLRRTRSNAVLLNQLRSPIDPERRQRRRRGIVPQGGAVVRRNESEITAFRLMKHVMNRDVLGRTLIAEETRDEWTISRPLLMKYDSYGTLNYSTSPRPRRRPAAKSSERSAIHASASLKDRFPTSGERPRRTIARRASVGVG